MTHLEQPPTRPSQSLGHSAPAGSTAATDAIVAIVVTALGGAAFIGLDVMERLEPTLATFERLELDDLLLTLILTLLATAWFAARRVAEGRRAIAALRDADRQRAEHLQQLEALSEGLIRTEADTREQLATRLHDGLSQSLYAAQLNVDVAVRNRDAGQHATEAAPTGARDALGEARRLITEAMQEARTLTGELHPPSLRDLGLLEALRAALPAWQRTYHVRLRLEDGSAWSRVPAAERARLYDCLRELVINAGKHADATTVAMRAIEAPGHTLALEVADDGRGFEPGTPRTGFGLMSIERRLRRLGGTLHIDSSPGQGTRARLVVPAFTP